MKKFAQKMKAILKDESGQGMTEYALLLFIVVALAAVFREPIKKMISEKMDALSGNVQKFDG